MEIIYASMTVLPENNKRFKDFLQNIIQGARKLQGCLRYDWYNNPENSNNFILYAEFDTESSYRLYKKSRVLLDINQQLFPLLSDEPTFRQFRASIIISHNV